jgi:hypothetical protein
MFLINCLQRSRRVSGVLALALIALLALTLAIQAAPSGSDNADPALPGLQPAELPALCADVTAIPTEECGALVLLYEATNGDNWNDNSGWLDLSNGKTPCDWSGVVCADGHVTGLQLAGNKLVGQLPRAIGRLSALRELQLARNRLFGNAPATLCDLIDTVQSADFAYNQLAPRAAQTRTCLDALDPDWASTQTTPPRELAITAFYADGFDLAWTPIAYDGPGRYEISFKSTFGGAYQVHGVTENLQAGAYRIDGLTPGQSYFIRVRSITPGQADQPAEVASEPAQTVGVTQANDRILLMVSISADNNLSSYVRPIVERIRYGSEVNPNMTAVVLADRLGEDNTDLAIIRNGVVTVTDAVEREWGKRELDMADPAVLTWFLTYARRQVPADRTMVSLIGHGVGPAPNIGWVPPVPPGEPDPPLQDGIPPLPQKSEFTPADVTDGSYISTTEMGRALAEATDNGANPFDILFFDQCFQGNIDVLYEVRNAAKVFIASPNYAWLIAPYAKYVAQLAPAATNEQIAQNIISRYEESLDRHHPNAIFWVKQADVTNIAAAISNLGGALTGALGNGQADAILNASTASLYVDTTLCGRQRFVLGQPDELMGAGSFALRLRSAFPPGDAAGVNAAAGGLLSALSASRGLSIVGSPYLAPDQVWDYVDRITLLAPLPRNAPASVAWRASVYSEQTPLRAVWTPDPTQRVVITETFSFVNDYGWDEFIGEWYTTPLTPTVGTWCYYTPPALVKAEDAEVLPLTVAEVGDGVVALEWDEPAEVDVVAYQVFTRGPQDVDRSLAAILEPNILTYYLTDLPAGEHQFMVAAVDEADLVVAETEVVTRTIARDSYIYLPVVTK